MLLGAYATYDTDRVKRRKNQESRRGKARWISPSKGFHCPRTVKKLGESDRETNADVPHHPSRKKITAIMDCAEP
jgi:hypothetical protein